MGGTCGPAGDPREVSPEAGGRASCGGQRCSHGSCGLPSGRVTPSPAAPSSALWAGRSLPRNPLGGRVPWSRVPCRRSLRREGRACAWRELGEGGNRELVPPLAPSPASRVLWVLCPACVPDLLPGSPDSDRGSPSSVLLKCFPAGPGRWPSGAAATSQATAGRAAGTQVHPPDARLARPARATCPGLRCGAHGAYGAPGSVMGAQLCCRRGHRGGTVCSATAPRSPRAPCFSDACSERMRWQAPSRGLGTDRLISHSKNTTRQVTFSSPFYRNALNHGVWVAGPAPRGSRAARKPLRGGARGEGRGPGPYRARRQ